MSPPTVMFPGDALPAAALPAPAGPHGALKLGPNLAHALPAATVVPTTAGILRTDAAKGAIWVEHDHGRYIPAAHDLVLATVQRSTADAFVCSLAPRGGPAALLPHLAFPGATRKTRPQLTSGALVYARVATASRNGLEPELTCVDPATGKAAGLGELAGGMLWGVSAGLARRLLDGGRPRLSRRKSKAGDGGGEGRGGGGKDVMGEDAGDEEDEEGDGGESDGEVRVLEALGEGGLAFEVCVGRNGRVWVDAGGVRETAAVGRALREVDEGRLGRAAQEKLAKRLLRELGKAT